MSALNTVYLNGGYHEVLNSKWEHAQVGLDSSGQTDTLLTVCGLIVVVINQQLAILALVGSRCGGNPAGYDVCAPD